MASPGLPSEPGAREDQQVVPSPEETELGSSTAELGRGGSLCPRGLSQEGTAPLCLAEPALGDARVQGGAAGDRAEGGGAGDRAEGEGAGDGAVGGGAGDRDTQICATWSLGTLPEDVLAAVVRVVSESREFELPALVCRRWFNFTCACLPEVGVWGPSGPHTSVHRGRTEEVLVAELGKFSSLESLELQNGAVDRLTSTFLEAAASHWPRLRHLCVHGGTELDFADEDLLVAGLGPLTSLEILALGGEPGLPAWASKLCELESLWFHSETTFADGGERMVVLAEDFFINISGLRSLKLTARGKTVRILSSSLGMLRHLTSLELEEAYGLEELPLQPSMCSLRRLYVEACDVHLPESVSLLCNLTNLETRSCTIYELPHTFGVGLWSLRRCRLDMLMKKSGSSGKPEVPSGIGLLQNLRVLEVCFSGDGWVLPPSFWTLSRLKQLSISGLGDTSGVDMTELPEELGSLQGLELLKVDSNRLSGLPETLGALSSLKRLIVHCCALQGLPKSVTSLTRLQVLKVDAVSVDALPAGIEFATGLTDIHIRSRLPGLPKSLGMLPNLVSLDLECKNLGSFPPGFKKLQQLKISRIWTTTKEAGIPGCVDTLLTPDDCSSLRRLEIGLNSNRLPDSLGALSAVQELKFGPAQKLKSLRDSFGVLLSLKRLLLSEFLALRNLPNSLGGLLELEHLKLVKCDALESFPDTFGGLIALKSLSLKWCPKLRGLPESASRITGLTNLSLKMCPYFWAASLPGCWKLKKLKIRGRLLTGQPDLGPRDICSAESVKLCCDGDWQGINSASLNPCTRLLEDRVFCVDKVKKLKVCSKRQPPHLRLPAMVASMTALRKLNLEGWISDCVVDLPEELSWLTGLEQLRLRPGALVRFPQELLNLPSLDVWSKTDLLARVDGLGRITHCCSTSEEELEI